MDRRSVVMSALGADRPGLVAQLSRYVAERGGNIEDSRMAALGGLFGLMVEITGTEEVLERVAREVNELERSSGLRAVVQTPREHATREGSGQPPRPSVGGMLLSIRASAFDREGLLMDLSDAMRSTGGNIVALDTSTYEEVETGHVYFRMAMSVEVGDEEEARAIEQRLRRLALREGVAVEMEVEAVRAGEWRPERLAGAG